MKYPFRDDYAVRVWPEEREAEIPETAHFWRGIYHITLWGIISHLRFVPTFSRNSESWPLTWLENSDIVHSEQEARLFMAGLAYIAITPDDRLAGKKEFFPFPPSPPEYSIPGPDKGVLFFVTSEQYDLFNEELYQIGKQTVCVNEFLRLSAVKHLSVIQYILERIVPFEKQWRKEWHNMLCSQPLNGKVSAIPVGTTEAVHELAVA